MTDVAVFGLLLGGYFWLTREPILELKLPAPSTRVNVDHEIFDIVLSDLLRNEEFVQFGKDEKKQVILDSRSEEGYGMKSVDDSDLKETLQEKAIDPEIVEDFHARNARRIRFDLTGYKPSNPDILVQELKDPRLSRFSLPRWVQASLPAYSKDGTIALFRFGFGPSAHGAEGFYLLKKANGRWEIVERKLFYFA
jgi:hypothetical protein